MNVQRLIETYNTYEEPQDWAEQAKEALWQLQNALEQETTMLRQQQDEIEALEKPKIPLLEQEIKFILGNGQCWQGEDCSMPNLMYIIRAVEAAHGIGVKQDEHL